MAQPITTWDCSCSGTHGADQPELYTGAQYSHVSADQSQVYKCRPITSLEMQANHKFGNADQSQVWKCKPITSLEMKTNQKSGNLENA
jgi:hypothetical protein